MYFSIKFITVSITFSHVCKKVSRDNSGNFIFIIEYNTLILMIEQKDISVKDFKNLVIIF